MCVCIQLTTHGTQIFSFLVVRSDSFLKGKDVRLKEPNFKREVQKKVAHVELSVFTCEGIRTSAF